MSWHFLALMVSSSSSTERNKKTHLLNFLDQDINSTLNCSLVHLFISFNCTPTELRHLNNSPNKWFKRKRFRVVIYDLILAVWHSRNDLSLPRGLKCSTPKCQRMSCNWQLSIVFKEKISPFSCHFLPPLTKPGLAGKLRKYLLSELKSRLTNCRQIPRIQMTGDFSWLNIWCRSFRHRNGCPMTRQLPLTNYAL